MKKTVLILFCSVLALHISAQKAAKVYQKAQTAFDKKDYEATISILDRLPKEEQTSAQCNKLLALSFDAIKRNDKAIIFYTRYVEQTRDSACRVRLDQLIDQEAKRQAAIKAKFEKIKDCPKCHGTDSVSSEIVCTKCLGFKQIKKRCTRCNGKGQIFCGACSGTGSVSNGNNSSTTCMKCGGTGGIACTSECDHGYLLEDCKYCTGTGYMVIQAKCDRHE